MPKTPEAVRKCLDKIKQGRGPDGNLELFDPEEYKREELGWVNSKAGMLLGYILHKLMIIPAMVDGWVFNKAKGVCDVIDVDGYAMTLRAKDGALVQTMDDSTKMTESLLLGWDKESVLAIFVPDDRRWPSLIEAVRLQIVTDEDPLENLAVYNVVDSCSAVDHREAGCQEECDEAFFLIDFQLGVYPLINKEEEKKGVRPCTVTAVLDFNVAKGLFEQQSSSRPYELVEHLEGLALVNPANHTAVVKLWGPNDFHWDSTASAT